MTSAGKNGLNIRTNASLKAQREQDQVSGGVSVLCWLAFYIKQDFKNHPVIYKDTNFFRIK